jgi:hypothetical protein
MRREKKGEENKHPKRKGERHREWDSVQYFH